MLGILKKLVVITLFAFFALKGLAQPSCSFQHFSTGDGLPQFSILDIIQDKKGFIWLGTYDGLSKFDGYDFYNYKIRSDDTVAIKSNRVDRIYEDKYGRIWIKSNSNEAFCFDSKTERFWGLPSSLVHGENPFVVSQIHVSQSGMVWVLSSGKGCICIADSTYHTCAFSKENQNLPDNTVNTVWEDQVSNTWVLTNNGLLCLPKNKIDKGVVYFENRRNADTNNNQRFFVAAEMDDEVWFGANNGCIECYSLASGSFSTINLPVSSDVTYISKLNGNMVLVCTASDGFLTYNRRSKETHIYNHTNVKGFGESGIQAVYTKSPNQFWFVNSRRGIYLYNFSTEELTYFHVLTEDFSFPASFPPSFVLEDPLTGRLWVHPLGGGFSIYNEEKNVLEPFYNLPNTADRKFSNVLHVAFFDRKGDLWLGARSNGLEKVVFNKRDFVSFSVSGQDALNNNYVRAFFEDDKKNLWVATKGTRLVIYDSNWHQLGCLSPEGEIKTDAQWGSAIYCVFCDANKNIWLGTRGDGVFKLTPKNHLYSFRVEHYKYEETNPYSLSNNNVYSIFQDRFQRIWLGTFGGGINIVDDTSDGAGIRFINYRNDLNNYPISTCNKVRCLAEDVHGHICAGTTNGLLIFPLSFNSPQEIDYHHYDREVGNNSSLSNNDVVCVYITHEGEMFVGTFGGGFSKVVAFDSKGFPNQFKTYSTADGLPSDLVQSVVEDESGKLWIGTQTELTRFDPQKEHFEVFAEAKRLLAENSFSESAACRLTSGELLFGYSDGIMKFRPSEISTNSYSPYLAFTNFQLFNKKVPIGDGVPLKTAIDDCPELRLSHKQNYFSIEFAALDFENTKSIRYAYKLEGFDEDWNYVQKQRVASYTNIPKGEYVFKVKSTNSDGVWGSNERQLPIEVLPSFWETPFAYVIYFLLFAIVVFIIDYYFLTIFRLKSDVKLEKKMSEMKLKFFTDISHEIRTPLTLITAPVEYLINDNRTPEMVKKQLSFISQNTNRMLRLVNQILDLRKIQDMRLSVTEVELALFVKDIFNDFSELAEDQHIDFSFQNLAGDATIWADKDSLEKIVMNLLSNAFKFVASGDKIDVTVQGDEKYVFLKVCDNGLGIAKERMKNLFVRFSSFNEDASKPSTGIGLALVKELADKHSAKVTVDSEVGKGSCFSVCFLRGTEHFGAEVELVLSSKPTRDEKGYMPESFDKGQRQSDNEKYPCVLVVEDDSELREFIKSILEPEYRVLEAGDGVEGLDLASSHNPDFVVSDIMMPRMDGIELLKHLRRDLITSHIPVVLLTAKTDIESKLEGLSYGADDYITKPFSVPYFKTRIVNLINQRKRLQEIFSESGSASTKEYNPKPFLITAQDEEIMGKIMAIIEQNIDNGDFTVEDLSAAVGVGRTTMFNKIKSLTGLSPVEFVRDIRIKRAAQLLTDSQLLIKEVSFMTGFSDTKYFGRCFKAKYGMTPLEYRNQEK